MLFKHNKDQIVGVKRGTHVGKETWNVLKIAGSKKSLQLSHHLFLDSNLLQALF